LEANLSRVARLVGRSAATGFSLGEVKAPTLATETKLSSRAVRLLGSAVVRICAHDERTADSFNAWSQERAVFVMFAASRVRAKVERRTNAVKTPTSRLANLSRLAAVEGVGSNVDFDANTVDTQLASLAWLPR
jgi:hypothetical protein